MLLIGVLAIDSMARVLVKVQPHQKLLRKDEVLLLPCKGNALVLHPGRRGGPGALGIADALGELILHALLLVVIRMNFHDCSMLFLTVVTWLAGDTYRITSFFCANVEFSISMITNPNWEYNLHEP